LKKLFFILALLAVSFQTVATGIVYLRFELNRDYIAKNLCVKKEIKNNCCQGSCHLKKQLGAEDKKERSPAPQIKVQGQLTLFFQSHSFVQFLPALFAGDVYLPYHFSKKPSRGFAVFHPPTC